MTSGRSRASVIALKPWWLGLAVGAALSSTVTAVVVIWEWLENPGGIFRGEQGTNWKFIFDTAISWFVPTFIYAAVIAVGLHLAWSVGRALYWRFKNPPDSGP